MALIQPLYLFLIAHVSLILICGPRSRDQRVGSTRSFDPTILLAPRHLKHIKRVWISPTRKMILKPSGLNNPTVYKGMTLPYMGRTKNPFINISIILYKIYSRHVGALRGSTWCCHVALRATSHPRGPRAHFFNFFIYFFIIKIENKIIENSEKYRKIPKNCKNHIF